MSDYKLTFKLKQHTPIIHFQHDQQGATLRASELKPKLDKFLIEKLGLTKQITKKGKIITIPEHDYENWFNDKENLSLDYKVSIKAIGRKEELDDLINLKIKLRKNKTGEDEEKLIPTNLPGFFGNMMKLEEFKDGSKKQKKITFYSNLTIYFTSFAPSINNRTILGEIKEYFAEFLATTNFGSRQSKGFGSFTIEKQNIKLFNNYYFTLQDKDGSDFKKLFNAIDLFYRCLKSGLNIKTKDRATGKIIDKMYFKSLMFRYAKELTPTEQWDKRTIRHALYIDDWKYKKDRDESGVYYKRTNREGTVHFSASKPENRKYYDFRDLLGLSTEQSWLFYYNKNVKKKLTKRETIDGKIHDFSIERFQSPFTLKPVYNSDEKKWVVFILTKEIPVRYKNANVAVTNNTTKSVELEIFPDFRVRDYIDYAIETFDKNDISYSNGYDQHKAAEAGIIINVFDELKRQKEKRQ